MQCISGVCSCRDDHILGEDNRCYDISNVLTILFHLIFSMKFYLFLDSGSNMASQPILIAIVIATLLFIRFH